MVRPPSFDTNGIKKGAWSEEEDHRLRAFIHRHGHPPNWRLLPILAGLARCGKSCRLRWVNYLQPGLKKGNFSKEEEDLIIKLHTQLGTKWSVIAERFPGRTDNDIKNYWHAHIKKRGKRNRVPTGTTTTADDRTKQEQHELSEVMTNCMNNNHQEGIVFTQGLYVEKPMIDGDHAYMVGQTHCNDDLLAEAYDNICFGQLSVDLPLMGEEFFDVGVSTFSDSSEGGITPSGSTSGESQESFWSRMSYEDDTVDMVLW